MKRPFGSRAAVHGRISAAYDQAATADALEATLDAAGWVTRLVAAHEVVVVLERPSGIPGLVDEIRFAGPTALAALQLATSWAISDDGAAS